MIVLGLFSGGLAPLGPESTGLWVIQLPCRLSLFYVDRAIVAGLVASRYQSSAIVVSALPSPRSRQLQRILQVGWKDCPMVSASSSTVLQVAFLRLLSSSAMADWCVASVLISEMMVLI